MKRKVKILMSVFISIVIVAGFSAYLFVFNEDSVAEMRGNYIQERAEAIEMAEDEGLYDCCIEPECTMCFDHGTEHTWAMGDDYCSCRELIAEGKEPCPQCKTGLIQGKGKIMES